MSNRTFEDDNMNEDTWYKENKYEIKYRYSRLKDTRSNNGEEIRTTTVYARNYMEARGKAALLLKHKKTKATVIAVRIIK